MTISLKHATTVVVPDDPTFPVGSSEYNAEHTTSMATNKLVGRGTAGTGAFEEITLGTGLSLTGTTLNGSAGGTPAVPGGTGTQLQYNNAGAFGGMAGTSWDSINGILTVPKYAIGSINAQTGTAYTLQASDNGGVVTLNNAAVISLTCPAGLGANFSCMIIQLGAGQVGVVAGSGATLGSLSGLTHLSGQNAMGQIIAPTANGFILGGQLS